MNSLEGVTKDIIWGSTIGVIKGILEVQTIARLGAFKNWRVTS